VITAAALASSASRCRGSVSRGNATIATACGNQNAILLATVPAA
jgi:hypothetical protein